MAGRSLTSRLVMPSGLDLELLPPRLEVGSLTRWRCRCHGDLGRRLRLRLRLRWCLAHLELLGWSDRGRHCVDDSRVTADVEEAEGMRFGNGRRIYSSYSASSIARDADV